MKKNTKSIRRGGPKTKNRSGEKSASSMQGLHALRGLFIDQLKDIYWAEKALIKAIPKMIKKASSEELIDALTDHLEVTRKQAERLEEVFSLLEVKAVGAKCEAMVGLIKEAEGIMAETEKGSMRDAGIIAAAQKVEHYEIATYGTLCSLARNLDEEEAAILLHETLEEEKEADETLTDVAEEIMQMELAEMAEEEEEEEENYFEDADTVITSRKKKQH